MSKFYLVLSDLRTAPLSKHLMHGYETRQDFQQALNRLLNRWKGRIGECINERHGFLLLRFHDTPGGKPDEAWLPEYLLQLTDPPKYISNKDSDSSDQQLNDLFGF